MITPDQALKAIPDGLRIPLLEEFKEIVNRYMEHKWSASELSGGRFCEIVYTILSGFASGTYPAAPNKPPNFVNACRSLESNTSLPRSFQILIPRILPALYEIRNNRNVGHVGGDVNPDHMDSSYVVSTASWVMAELIRVLHGTSTEEAHNLVENLTERRTLLVWKSGTTRRVLSSSLSVKDQVFILLGSCSGPAKFEDLIEWTEYKNRTYFKKMIRQLHQQRLIEYKETKGEIELLPPGADYASKIILSNS